MKKTEAGQAFILVLILLAIGALLIVPTLRLTQTALKSSQIMVRETKALYAAEAAQEYVLWKLRWGGFTDCFQNDGDTEIFPVNVCGIPMEVAVVMRAMESKVGITLATNDVIRPTKTVKPSAHFDWGYKTYEYTINLEQLSDNTTQGLDAIYDLPPGGFGSGAYHDGTSQLSLDGGQTWLDIPDPQWNAAKGYLKWPADYDWETGTGAFSSDPLDENHYFHGIRDFEVRQVKKIRFQMYGRLANNKVHCNWVVLKPWNTVSGPQAPITVGSPDNPGECEDYSVLEVTKDSLPKVIQPKVETEIEYTMHITNLYTQTRHIQEITDYLPPGFEYLGPTSSEMVNPSEDIQILEPEVNPRNINGVDRLELLWTTQKFPNKNAISIASGQMLKLTFMATATEEASGSYYNEVIVILTETGLPPGFGDIGVLPSEYGSNYSWNTGMILVPYYDSRVDAGAVIIEANMAMTLGGIAINSWQIMYPK